MRHFSLWFVVGAFFCLALGGLTSEAEAHTLVRLTADHISFYYDRYQVEADGNVRLTTSDGVSISADAFSMDLKLNRFLVAGHVQLQSRSGHLAGAALADFLDFKRVYFIPVTTAPDRWTYENGDYVHPIKGRQMPGDAFSFPDLSKTRVSLNARSVEISEKSFVRFAGVTTYLFGVPAPLPSFYVNFSPNVNLAQNSLSGATADATWNITGNDNAITALHVRYDTLNKFYLSFEQHFAGEHEYAVFSVNPFTKYNKNWNLLAEHDIGGRFQLRAFSQLFTEQHGLSLPHASAQATYLWATQAFPHSSLLAFANFTDYNLLGPASQLGPNAYTVGELNHPSQMQLTWSSFNNRVGRLPLYEQTRFGIGFNHDSYNQGLQTYGGYRYTTIWNNLVGLTLYTAPIKLGNHDNPYKTMYVNAQFDKQRQTFTVPHHIDTTTTTGSLSRQFSRSLSAYLSYAISNTGDYYLQGGYQPYTPTVDGNLITSYAAFRGVSSQRTTTLALNYAPNPDFNATFAVHKHDDFPIAVPGLFPLPALNNLGQFATNFFGQPPYDVSADVRARVAPHIMVDVARSYYFNFGTLRWSPQFTVQVTQ